MRDCIDSNESPCSGEVFPRLALSGSGERYERCDSHYEAYAARLQPILQGIRQRYPEHPPSDFDESYAGERWDEDY